MNPYSLFDDPTHVRHCAAMLDSYRERLGHELFAADDANQLSDWQQAEQLYRLPAVVLCHDGAADPVFNYANEAAQRLFEYSWETFLTLPSRLSAEPDLRSDRSEMLRRAAEQGFIRDYSGVRISASGKRFAIRNATIWTVCDSAGAKIGQAAVFDDWTSVPEQS